MATRQEHAPGVPLVGSTNYTAAELAAVNADALIEGRADNMSALTAQIQAQFPAALAAFVARLQAADDAWMDRGAPNLPKNVIEIDPEFRGRRFVRIVRRDGDHAGARASRGVVCFVELGTGLIYKAATFKKPAENFTRGCVFDLGDMFLNKTTGEPAAVLPSF